MPHTHTPLLFSSIIHRKMIKWNSPNFYYIITTVENKAVCKEEGIRQKRTPFLVTEGSREEGPASHLKSHLFHCISVHSSLIGMHHWSPFPFSLEPASTAYCLINSHLILSAKRCTTVLPCFPISVVGAREWRLRLGRYFSMETLCIMYQFHLGGIYCNVLLSCGLFWGC